MEDTEKYLIHAAITANGVVERSDVVGAIFGQTEGLLGDDLDLRDLQQSSKVGRIDVEIDSQNGQSFGTITIASSLDRVKTAILAASLETITRVGPCRATVEVTEIEDVREAKRREVVERAKELLSESFDESVMSSNEILEEVKESVRIEDIGEYEGLPAGPNVADSDAVVVVEGRADVLTLLGYGIKNAVAVEGTNVPEAVAELTQERTTTAFFDGDRGGELILRELSQVGDVDYVAFAPAGRSVEDLKRHEVFAALRDKVPMDSFEFEAAAEEDLDADADADTDGDADATAEDASADPRRGSPTTESASAAPDVERAPAPPPEADPADLVFDADSDPEASAADLNGASATGGPDGAEADSAAEPAAESESKSASESGPEPESKSASESGPEPESESESEAETAADTDPADAPASEDADERTEDSESDSSVDADGDAADSEETGQETDGTGDETPRPQSLGDHVREVIDGDTGRIRLLDDDLVATGEYPVEEAFDALSEAEPAPYAAVVDGEFTQRLLDVAAQRGVDHAVADSTGEFVKKPVGVRLLTADQLARSVAN
ncbi:DNA primase DnaG [Halobellus rubicundus]|uniref:DNA primase DnaG n=1 Tax=Halobellus rubicundus TaxID=2996466 RepID=A0ABD5M776_9EURY